MGIPDSKYNMNRSLKGLALETVLENDLFSLCNLTSLASQFGQWKAPEDNATPAG